VGYVGSRSVHLSVAADDINLVQPSTTATSAGILIPIGGTAIDPNWAGGTGGAGIRPVIFDGSSSYEGAQAQLKKSMATVFKDNFRIPTASVETQAPLQLQGHLREFNRRAAPLGQIV